MISIHNKVNISYISIIFLFTLMGICLSCTKPYLLEDEDISYMKNLLDRAQKYKTWGKEEYNIWIDTKESAIKIGELLFSRSKEQKMGPIDAIKINNIWVIMVPLTRPDFQGGILYYFLKIDGQLMSIIKTE